MRLITTLDYQQKIAEAIDMLDHAQELFIQKGTDDHLDAILEFQDILQTCIQRTIAITDSIESKFNLFTREKAQEIISLAFPVFQAADRVFNTLEKTGLAEDVASYIADFKLELKELREILNDLSRFKAGDTGKWNDLLNG